MLLRIEVRAPGIRIETWVMRDLDINTRQLSGGGKWSQKMLCVGRE